MVQRILGPAKVAQKKVEEKNEEEGEAMEEKEDNEFKKTIFLSLCECLKSRGAPFLTVS